MTEPNAGRNLRRRDRAELPRVERLRASGAAHTCVRVGVERLRSVHVTYDGLLDPLGGSQVVPYLICLARRDLDISVVSFEKPQRWIDVARRAALSDRLDSAGIKWIPLRYHKWPRLPATAWDVARGAVAVAAEARRSRPTIVHARGDVAMAIARNARVRAGARLVYEVRGLFSDERVEVDSWRPGSLIDRVVRRVEAANLHRADGLLMVMSEHGCRELAARRQPLPPHRNLPNCVDLEAFSPRPAGREARFGLAYCGSLGGWYMTREMVEFAREAAQVVSGRVLFLTPQIEEARRAGVSSDWAELRTAAPSEVPSWMQQARAAFFLIRPTPAKRASSPTKVAEALASGLPIVANRGIGDLDDVIERERIGVLVDGFSRDHYRRAAERLTILLEDPGLSERCRRLAEKRYSLAAAVDIYRDLYRAVLEEARVA